MTHVYEGKPDARQSDDNAIALHDEIKNKAAELETVYAKVVTGRYHSLAVTALEQSVMWVVKELTK